MSPNITRRDSAQLKPLPLPRPVAGVRPSISRESSLISGKISRKPSIDPSFHDLSVPLPTKPELSVKRLNSKLHGMRSLAEGGKKPVVAPSVTRGSQAHYPETQEGVARRNQSALSIPTSRPSRKLSRFDLPLNEGELARIVLQGVESQRKSAAERAKAPMDAGRIAAVATNPATKSVGKTLQGVADCIQLLDVRLPGLINALEEMSKLHPLASASFYIVKAAFELYLARRENDKRIQTLYYQMSEVGLILIELGKVKPFTKLLPGKVKEVADDIRECAKTCHAYSKTGAVVKFIRAGIWTKDLVDLLQLFMQRRSELQMILQTHVVKRQEQMHESLIRIEDMTEIFLNQFVSEKELALREEQRSWKIDPNQSIDSMLKRLLQHERLQALKADLMGDTRAAVRRIEDEFDVKFKAAMSKQEMRLTHVIREGNDQLFVKITNYLQPPAITPPPPYDRITDQTLRAIWKYMTWSGHAEARQFVMALRDHFIERSSVTSLSSTESASREVDEQWALEYIGPRWQQHLMDAIDDDSSGYVTIAELNNFTNSLPKDLNWSLPRWLAYWAVGWHLDAISYVREIRHILASMLHTLPQIPPHNRNYGDQYFDTVWRYLFPLITSLHPCPVPNGLRRLFEKYTLYEENRLEQNLKEIKYNVDAVDTLRVNVVGSSYGRIEKHILAVVALLLRKHLKILRTAIGVNFDEDELDRCANSIGTCARAISLRISDLSDYLRAQGHQIDVNAILQSTACGLFKNVCYGNNIWSTSTVQKYSLGYRDIQQSLAADIETSEEQEAVVSENDYQTLSPLSPEGTFPLFEFRSSRCLPHHETICYYCHSPIIGVRIICLDCWDPNGQIWDSRDLCSRQLCIKGASSHPEDPHTHGHTTMLKIRTYLHLNDKAALLQQAKKISTRHLQPHHDPQSSHGEVKTSESFGDTSIDVVWGSDPEVPTLHQDNSWLPDYSGIRTMSPSAQLDALDLPSAFSEEVMSGRTERSEHHGVLRAEAGAFVMSPLHELDAQDLSPMPFEEMRIYDGKADKNYSPSTNSDVIKISVEPPSRSESLSSADDHKYFPMMLMSPDTGSLDPSSNIPPPEPSILETGSKIQCCICHDSPFPSYWACIECSDDESEYLICDNCEDAQYLACHLCAETFVQPSWYFGCHGDDQFLCGACTKLGRSSALPIGSDRHVYTHALVRRPCLLQPPVDLTCKPLHSADPLWVVQDHVTEIRQDVQVIKDRMEQVHVAVGTTGDSSVAHSRAYHAAVETRVAAVERRVELIDNRLELVQIQTDRITEYLERLLSESKDRPAFVVSPILQEQPGRSDES